MTFCIICCKFDLKDICIRIFVIPKLFYEFSIMVFAPFFKLIISKKKQNMKEVLKRAYILFIVGFTGYIALAQDHPFPTKEQLTGVKVDDLVLNSGFLGDYKTDFGMLIVTENEDKNSNKIELPVIRIHSKSERPKGRVVQAGY